MRTISDLKNFSKSLNPLAIRIALVLSVGLFGYATGYSINAFFFSRFLGGGSGLMYLVYQPTFEHVYVRNRLYSDNDLIRLSAYYALFDYGRIDESLLMRRYTEESEPYIKRSLIWMLGYSANSRRVLHFFEKEYRASSPELQVEMLKSLRRIDAMLFDEFIRSMKVAEPLVRQAR